MQKEIKIDGFLTLNDNLLIQLHGADVYLTDDFKVLSVWPLNSQYEWIGVTENDMQEFFCYPASLPSKEVITELLSVAVFFERNYLRYCEMKEVQTDMIEGKTFEQSMKEIYDHWAKSETGEIVSTEFEMFEGTYLELKNKEISLKNPRIETENVW
jgi:hypothetical protein